MLKILHNVVFILAICIPIKALSAADNEIYFASKVVDDGFTTIIVAGDKAIARVLNTHQIVYTVTTDETTGKTYVKNDSTAGQKAPETIHAEYQYYIPEDKCYILTNLYKVCTNKGKVVTLVKYSKASSAETDPFFDESNDECNLFKFNIAYKIFLLGQKYDFIEYQIATSGYPDFIKMVIVDYEQIVKGISRVDFERSKNLRAFFVSSGNDIGCVPFSKLKLFTNGEAQVYKMYIPPYKLVGQILDSEKDREVFIEINKSRVIKYNTKLIDNKPESAMQ